MKKLLIAMTMMCAMAMAQTSDTQTSTTEHKDHAKAEKAGGKEKTVKGCLHKDGDNFWLKTRTTKYHVMPGQGQDLTAHDGHEVKVTGTTSKGPLPGAADQKSVNHLEASNVEMVSEKCSMGEKSMKMKGGELEKKDTSK